MLGFGMIHSHFVASEGNTLADQGFFSTTEENQVIEMPKGLNTIEIFADDTDVMVKFNNDESIMFIPAKLSDGVTGLPVQRIIVLGPAGQRVKWMGLTSIDNI